MIRAGLLWLSEQPRIFGFVRSNGLARRFASRFVAGETVADAVGASQRLNAAGVSASLDLLGEAVQSRAEARAARDTYLETLERIRAVGAEANVSLKLTQMGLDIDEALCLANVRAIIAKARSFESFVRIDMEQSTYVDRTLRLFTQAFHPKGAYKEPADVAFPAKRDVDRSYVRCMDRLLEGGNYPGIATHDVKIIAHAKEFTRQKGIPPGRFEFQLLYGVRRDLQHRLRREGYNARVYVPFGDHWYPYLLRRLAERPANIAFLLGSMVKESLRRS